MTGRPPGRDTRGVALLFVLVMVTLLITAIYLFQRRAVLHVTVAQNRIAAGRADALARGGLRMAEAILFLNRLQEESSEGLAESADGEPAAPSLGGAGSSDLWQQIGSMPIDIGEDATLRIVIESTGSRLNLNALVPQSADPDDAGLSQSEKEEAQLYLREVIRYIVEGMDVPRDEKRYDEDAIARNLIDWMDADDTSLGGGGENTYYSRQDPPYRARNGPFLSVDEIGLVEGVDPALLEAMRAYLTVHPIGGRDGIDLNTAPPWVLSLVYAGPSGDRDRVNETTVRNIWSLRKEGRLVCTEDSADPVRCVALTEVGLGEGSVYPPAALPAKPQVFRVEAHATVGSLTRRIEAVIDVRDVEGPQLLSWRRLRGPG